MVGWIGKLIVELARKTPFGSVVISSELGLSGRSFLTDAQNVFFQGSLKPMPKQLKSAGKCNGRGLKSFGTRALGETTPETTSLKLIK
jgi:hypothetical protein